MTKKILWLHPYDPPRTIKLGFYWQAALAPELWCLSEGLVRMGTRSFLFTIVIGLIAEFVSKTGLESSTCLLLIPIGIRNVWYGRKASRWLQEQLKNKGYKAQERP